MTHSYMIAAGKAHGYQLLAFVARPHRLNLLMVLSIAWLAKTGTITRKPNLTNNVLAVFHLIIFVVCSGVRWRCPMLVVSEFGMIQQENLCDDRIR